MSRRAFSIVVGFAMLVGAVWSLGSCAESAAEDPLPSWRDGPVKQKILAFVDRVTKQGGPDYVPPEERIATFDNDGTLWSEKPLYFQLFFALDRVRALAAEHPEWKDEEPFRAVLEDDRDALSRMDKEALLTLVGKTHSGVRANDFRVWICSAGGTDFMRVFAEEVYGVPRSQVIGSLGKSHFELRDGSGVVLKDPGIARVNDRAAKPVSIDVQVGRRPILAGGNSDGDLEMLQYADRGTSPGLAILVHHDDAEREWAYDRDSAVGRLDKALLEAQARGWSVVSMKRDWRRIYIFETLER